MLESEINGVGTLGFNLKKKARHVYKKGSPTFISISKLVENNKCCIYSSA